MKRRGRAVKIGLAGCGILLVVFAVIFFVIRRVPEENIAYHYSEDVSFIFGNDNQVVASIRKSLKAHDRLIILRFQSEQEVTEDISVVVGDIMNFALYDTDAPDEGDYLRYQYGGYTISYSHVSQENGYEYEVGIEPVYYTTCEQEEAVDEKVAQILEELEISDRMPDIEKIRRIYGYVYEHVEYDDIHKKNENYHLKSTAYGALIYERALCQGYSVAMYRLLREAGIDARIITGYARRMNTDSQSEVSDATEFHAWNLVCLNGKYYNVDVTWDKLLGTEEYFMKSDRSFDDHVRDAEFLTEEFYQRYPMAEEDY
ncbi:MAG: hypothetical protein IJ567_04655 [Lachnospiraceae bacterium]|nr:hypothetical protein [Lachnospiraceae bacterium]